AALDVAGDARGDFAQGLRFALLGEDAQALRDRQAGVDHRRELPRVDGEVLVLDLAAELRAAEEARAGRLGLLLLDRGRDDALAAKERDGAETVLRLDLARDRS